MKSVCRRGGSQKKKFKEGQKLNLGEGLSRGNLAPLLLSVVRPKEKSLDARKKSGNQRGLEKRMR